MFVLSSKLFADPARKQNTSDAIQMIEILNDHLKGKEDAFFDDNARQYFIECFDAFLNDARTIKSSKGMVMHIAKCLNLTSSRGRKMNDPDAYYQEALEIYNIKKDRNVSLEEAIKTLQTHPDYKDFKISIDTRALRNAYNRHLPEIEQWDKIKCRESEGVNKLRSYLKTEKQA